MVDRSKALFFVILVTLITLLSGCKKDGPQNAPDPELKMRASAEELAKDVARVTKIGVGDGTPILIFEEDHSSRLQQVEQAIVLVRAYDKGTLKRIVVEGYVQEGPRVSYEALRQIGTAEGRSAVALGRLERGECSSAEFLSWLFRDIEIIPAESVQEYRLETFQKSIAAEKDVVMSVLTAGAEHLTGDDRAAFVRTMNQLAGAQTEADKERLMKELLKLAGKSDPAVGRILSTDGKDQRSIEQELSDVKAVKELISTTNGMSSKDAAPIEEETRLLDLRSKASLTMVANLEAARSAAPSIALIIGAGHTARVTAQLSEKKLPYAVFTAESFSMAKDPSAYSSDEYDRLMASQPAEPGGIAAQLRNWIVPAHGAMKNPPQSLRPDWQAESELYEFTAVLLGEDDDGDGAVPVGPPTLSLQDEGTYWSLKRWAGRFVSINLPSIVWLDDNDKVVNTEPWDRKRRCPTGATHILFDARVTRENSMPATTLTVKARLGTGANVPAQRVQFQKAIADRIDTAKLLKEMGMIRTRLKDGKKPIAQVPNEKGVYQLQPTQSVNMLVGFDHLAVAATKFSKSI